MYLKTDQDSDSWPIDTPKNSLRLGMGEKGIEIKFFS